MKRAKLLKLEGVARPEGRFKRPLLMRASILRSSAPP